jgi:hypothetical protein
MNDLRKKGDYTKFGRLFLQVRRTQAVRKGRRAINNKKMWEIT